MIPKPKLIVFGHARHGKDTVCEMLRDDYGFVFISSSQFCAEEVVFPHMADRYATADECFADRANHRAEWFDRIADYNREDQTALGRAILTRHDIYCGIRNRTEFQAMRNAGIGGAIVATIAASIWGIAHSFASVQLNAANNAQALLKWRETADDAAFAAGQITNDQLIQRRQENVTAANSIADSQGAAALGRGFGQAGQGIALSSSPAEPAISDGV